MSLTLILTRDFLVFNTAWKGRNVLFVVTFDVIRCFSCNLFSLIFASCLFVSAKKIYCYRTCKFVSLQPIRGAVLLSQPKPLKTNCEAANGRTLYVSVYVFFD